MRRARVRWKRLQKMEVAKANDCGARSANSLIFPASREFLRFRTVVGVNLHKCLVSAFLESSEQPLYNNGYIDSLRPETRGRSSQCCASYLATGGGYCGGPSLRRWRFYT